MDTPDFPAHVPLLGRLALALAIGLFVGMEREHRDKEAGLRTFSFVSVLGALGGVLGGAYGIVALLLVGVLVVLLNYDVLKHGERAELTTSAALMVVTFTGLLAGMGQTITPIALAVMVAALLAWKKRLVGFTRTITDTELRSAILLAMLAFVIYPSLPEGSIDPWDLVEPRTAWITVILVAALGFVNYILLKIYGDRGIVLTGFLGGFVNNKVTAVELATRAKEIGKDELSDVAYRGIVLANGSMLFRNALILGLLTPAAFLAMPFPYLLMLVMAAYLVYHRSKGISEAPVDTAKGVGDVIFEKLDSPFSFKSALKLGAAFLVLQIAGTLALRQLGEAGLYLVALLGGIFSSAGAVASIVNLVRQGETTPWIGAMSVMLASVSSLLFSIPFVSRFGRNPVLTRRVSWALLVVATVGIVASGVHVLFRNS